MYLQIVDLVWLHLHRFARPVWKQFSREWVLQVMSKGSRVTYRNVADCGSQQPVFSLLCSYVNRFPFWAYCVLRCKLCSWMVYRTISVHIWVWIGFSTTDWRPWLDLQLVFVTDRMALHSVHSDVHKVTRLARSFAEYPHRCWRSRTSRQCSRCHYCIAISRQVCPLYCWISAVLFVA